MKILLYGLNFAPELTGIGKYTGEMGAWLAAAGHQVRVVTAPPYYPAWKISPGYSGRSWNVANWQGVAVYRCPLWVPQRPNGIKRVLHLASFALSSLPTLALQLFWRPQVVWVVEPALFCAPAAVALARLCRAKAWLHVQDFELDAAFDLGLLRGNRLRRTAARAERWLMSRFDVVSTISQRMHQRLLEKGVDAARARLLGNWVDMAAFKSRGSESPVQPAKKSYPAVIPGTGCDGALGLSASADVFDYRAELGIPADAVVALYSGNMGAKQGLEVLAEVARLSWRAPPAVDDSGAAREIRSTDANMLAAPARRGRHAVLSEEYREQIVFVFGGDGAGRADLVTRCQGLPNVRFIALQPLERLPALLAFADIHLLPQRAGAADLVMPSKLTGMLASGRPVVATAVAGSELANVVGGDGGPACGLVVAPDDVAALALAVRTLAADPALRQRLGAAGRAYAQANLDRDAVLQRFEADLMALGDAGAGAEAAQ
jgi:colanic acid biosynthesis glycosyl transferase WcaI